MKHLFSGHAFTALPFLLVVGCSKDEKTTTRSEKTIPMFQCVESNEKVATKRFGNGVNLHSYSHAEEPYITLSRTAQLMDMLNIRGWSLEHIESGTYSIHVKYDDKLDFLDEREIKPDDPIYLHMQYATEGESIQLYLNGGSSISLPSRFTTGAAFKTDPIPAVNGTHVLAQTNDGKGMVILKLTHCEARKSRLDTPHENDALKTSRLLNTMEIRGYNISHIKSGGYKVYIECGGNREFLAGRRIDPGNAEYIFLRYGREDGQDISLFSLTNTESCSWSLPSPFPSSAKFRTAPIPAENGSHTLLEARATEGGRVILELSGIQPGKDASF